MFGLTINEAKANFFDVRKIRNKTASATEKSLSRAGAFVRQTARQSMKKAPQKSTGEMMPQELADYGAAQMAHKAGGKAGNKPKRPLRSAPPGTPPFWITRKLKDFLFFSWDKSKNCTIVGPAKLVSSVSNTTAEALEKGGPSGSTKWMRVRGRWVKVRRIVQIRKHAYMVPALRKNLSKIAPLFRNKVK